MFYNPFDYDCNVTKTVGLWFVEVVKKNLCVQYFRENNEENSKIND